MTWTPEQILEVREWNDQYGTFPFKKTHNILESLLAEVESLQARIKELEAALVQANSPTLRDLMAYEAGQDSRRYPPAKELTSLALEAQKLEG